jgi:hypothetical protein
MYHWDASHYLTPIVTPFPCILPCSLSSMLFFFLLILLLLFLASGYSLVSGRLLLLRTLALASLALVRAC